MEDKYFVNLVINKEKLSDGSDIFVVQCTNLGITSQGKTTEEAIEMVREAIELYLEECPDAYEELQLQKEPPMFSFMEVIKNVKTSDIVREGFS